VKDVNKETTSANVTDGAGLYDTGAIVEDHYLLTFTKQGFKTFVRGPIDLGLEKGAVLFDGCLPRVQQTVSVADAASGRDHSDPRVFGLPSRSNFVT
jgi:hypothetical protein